MSTSLREAARQHSTDLQDLSTLKEFYYGIGRTNTLRHAIMVAGEIAMVMGERAPTSKKALAALVEKAQEREKASREAWEALAYGAQYKNPHQRRRSHGGRQQNPYDEFGRLIRAPRDEREVQQEMARAERDAELRRHHMREQAREIARERKGHRLNPSTITVKGPGNLAVHISTSDPFLTIFGRMSGGEFQVSHAQRAKKFKTLAGAQRAAARYFAKAHRENPCGKRRNPEGGWPTMATVRDLGVGTRVEIQTNSHRWRGTIASIGSFIATLVGARGGTVNLIENQSGKWMALLAPGRDLGPVRAIVATDTPKAKRSKRSNPFRSYRGHSFYSTAGVHRISKGPTFNRLSDLRAYIDAIEDGSKQ